MFSSIPSLEMALRCDKLKFLNTLPDVPWGIKSSLVGNNWSRVIVSPLTIWMNKIGAPQSKRLKKAKGSLQKEEIQHRCVRLTKNIYWAPTVYKEVIQILCVYQFTLLPKHTYTTIVSHSANEKLRYKGINSPKMICLLRLIPYNPMSSLYGDKLWF